MTAKTQARGSRGAIFWPLAFIIIGILLLLNNFLLLKNFSVVDLWPLLLVLLGLQILIRGDIVPANDFVTFAITRGSVEEGTLEINAAEIDLSIRELPEEASNRLIAGKYAAKARPELEVTESHAYLKLSRQQTPWLTFADWELGIARNMPWQIAISSNLGQIQLDASQMILNGGVISSGIGDIHFMPPFESFEPIALHSTMGNIHIHAPQGYHIKIHVAGSRFFHAHVDATRYDALDHHQYQTRHYTDDAHVVELFVSGTFGDLYLS